MSVISPWDLPMASLSGGGGRGALGIPWSKDLGVSTPWSQARLWTFLLDALSFHCTIDLASLGGGSHPSGLSLKIGFFLGGGRVIQVAHSQNWLLPWGWKSHPNGSLLKIGFLTGWGAVPLVLHP